MIDKIKQHKWINYGRWIQPPLSGTFWCYWNETQSLKELFGKRLFNPILFLHGHTLMNKKDQVSMQSMLSDMFKSNTAALFRVKLEHVAIKYKFQHLALLNTDYQEEQKYIQELFRTYQEIVGLWWFGVAFGDELQNYILKEKLVSSEEKLLKKINENPRTEKTWLEMQNEEINTFAGFYIDTKKFHSSNLQDTIKSHVSHFDWFGTHHWMGNAYSKEKCLKQIKEQSKNKRQRLKANEEMINLLGSIMFWRTHCAEVTAKVVFRSRERLQKVAKSVGLTYDELLYFSSHDILSSFSNKTAAKLLQDKNIIQERESGYGCFIDEKGLEHIITGQKFIEAMNTMIEVKTQDKTLKGTVASKGPKVKGKIKVLLEPKGFANFSKGNILVAPETTPDFVPYMKLASAVITDRGGITSHAAIISRGLNIPCITGTQRATAILKDGMTVEVDAENNRISIIDNK